MTTLLTNRSEVRPATEYPAATGYPRVNRPRIVVAAARRCLAIDGTEPPGGPEFQAAMGALYSVAYGLVFRLRDRGVDAHASPPEALWDRRSGAQGWSVGEEAFDPKAWHWTLLLSVPADADERDIDAALREARTRRPTDELEHVRVIELDEGLVVEAMHVGPYAMEPETLEVMRRVAAEARLEPHGAHHEIYLGDPKRTAPERLRTVLRQPVRPIAH